MRIHPVAVKPLHDYILSVTFSNGEHRHFDVKPYLEMPFFAPLKTWKSSNRSLSMTSLSNGKMAETLLHTSSMTAPFLLRRLYNKTALV